MTSTASFALSASKPLERNAKREQNSRYGHNNGLMPVSCRRALIDLSDDVATKVEVLFYADAADALRKAVHE
jgi:hypothetical protein